MAATAPNKTALAAPNKTALAAPNKTALAAPNKTALAAPKNATAFAAPKNATALPEESPANNDTLVKYQKDFVDLQAEDIEDDEKKPSKQEKLQTTEDNER